MSSNISCYMMKVFRGDWCATAVAKPAPAKAWRISSLRRRGARGEAEELRPMGAQSHGDEQVLAALDDPAEQADKPPRAERTFPRPIGIGL